MAWNAKRHDIGFLRADGTTKVGLILARKKGIPIYRLFDDEYILKQQATIAGYDALPSEKELLGGQNSWHNGFGQEIYDPNNPYKYHESYGIDLRRQGMVHLSYKPTTIAVPTSVTTVTPTFTNMDMEVAASGWVAGARSNAVTAHSGSFEWLTAVGGGGEATYQDASNWTDAWQSKTFTLCGWGYQSTAKIGLNDGVTTTWSRSPAGAAWEFLSIAKTLAANATALRIVLFYSGGSEYYDDISIGSPIGGVITAQARFNDFQYFGFGNILMKLNVTGDGWTILAYLPNAITSLVPMVISGGDYLFIGQGWDVVGDHAKGLSHRYFYMTKNFAGTHTAGASGTVMTDTSASFVTNALRNGIIINTTTGNSAIIISNTATTVTVASITGNFNLGNAYTIAENVTQSDLKDGASLIKCMKFFGNYYGTANTMIGAATNNTTRTTVNPLNGGTEWSAATTIDTGSNDINGILVSGNLPYIPKEDRPFYINTSGQVKVLTDQTRAIASSTGGVNSYEWEGRQYFPYGVGGLLEYDAGTFTWLNPSEYGTSISEWSGRVIGLAGDEEWLFACVNGTNTIGVLSGKYDENGDFIWHTYQTMSSTAGASLMFVSSVYQKRLWITQNSATDAVYYIPLPSSYGDLTTDTNRSFPTSGTYYFTTPWLHLNFRADVKAWVKNMLTMSNTTTNIYWTAYYQIRGGSWVSIGDYKTSPTTSKFIDNTNKPSSTMMRFKFIAVTNSATTTPVLYGYDVRALLYPSRRDIIYCVVRCADDIELNGGGKDRDTNYATIKATLEEAKNSATWLVTMYDYNTDGTTPIYVKVLPPPYGVPFAEPVLDEISGKVEMYYHLYLQKVALS